jgi:hypothetical protein
MLINVGFYANSAFYINFNNGNYTYIERSKVHNFAFLWIFSSVFVRYMLCNVYYKMLCCIIFVVEKFV